MSQKRIEEEVGKLLVVCWLVYAETVFESSADNQLIDQWVAFAVDLPPLAFAVHCPAVTPDRDAPTRGCSIGANDSILVVGGMKLSIHCQHSDRHFQNNRIDVEAGHCVGSVI